MEMRRLMALFVVLVMSLAATACSWDEDGLEDDDGYVRWEGMNDEYHAAVASFPYPLPEGIVFPADAPYDPRRDDNTWFWVGEGELSAYEFAECAYRSLVIQNQYVDFAAAMSALDSAEEIHNAPFHQTYPRVVIGPSWQSVIDEVRQGDFSAYKEIYETDCVGGWTGFK